MCTVVDFHKRHGEDGDGEEQSNDDAAAIRAVALIVWVAAGLQLRGYVGILATNLPWGLF